MNNDQQTRLPVRRALISVYDKTGLEDLVRALHELGVQLVSTGSTASKIAAAGVPVTPVEDVTRFPECLDGRVKTLHPSIHAGLLAVRDNPDHMNHLQQYNIEPFDLLVSNLYPFSQTVASGASPDECVEQIDIGGPAMVRSSAKNHASVAVVTSPAQYEGVLASLRAGGLTLSERARLAAEAFAHTGSYDVAVAQWMAEQTSPGHSDVMSSEPDSVAATRTAPQSWLGETWSLVAGLRYGENPHQSAALYRSQGATAGIACAKQLHGKEMSYNNYVDADAALRAAYDFEQPAVAIVKHAQPCGLAVADTIDQAHRKAFDCDPVSAFGGIVAANQPVNEAMAQAISGVFTEVVVAPAYDDAALKILQEKKNVRLLIAEPDQRPNEMRLISGGALRQHVDRIDAPGDSPTSWTLVAGDPADQDTLADLVFAWRAVRSVKSNAILLAKDQATVGIGMGQVNRVDSCRLAVDRAGELRAQGSVAASDAFFPFADGLQILLDAGVRAVVQPGGSMRDDEVIAAAAQAGITMYTTGVRHFLH